MGATTKPFWRTWHGQASFPPRGPPRVSWWSAHSAPRCRLFWSSKVWDSAGCYMLRVQTENWCFEGQVCLLIICLTAWFLNSQANIWKIKRSHFKPVRFATFEKWEESTMLNCHCHGDDRLEWERSCAFQFVTIPTIPYSLPHSQEFES